MNLLELYNAIHKTNYTDKENIEINTMKNAIFMGRVNDLSFLYRGSLITIIEHQSTINPNMALRLFLYAAKLYEKMADGRQIYSSKKMNIPRPEFIVLYNGKEDLPAESVLKLSDMYKGFEGHEGIELELEVKVYNINKGMNPQIESRSPLLHGYTSLIWDARRNEDTGMDKDEAVRKAVLFCKRQGLLIDFLKEYGSEVENMLITEWDWADALQVNREEGWEEGWEKGIEVGIEKGREEGMEKGREEGMEKGRVEGMEKGRVEMLNAVYNIINKVNSIEEFKRLFGDSLPKDQDGSTHI
jgi:hypothetical protein